MLRHARRHIFSRHRWAKVIIWIVAIAAGVLVDGAEAKAADPPPTVRVLIDRVREVQGLSGVLEGEPEFYLEATIDGVSSTNRRAAQTASDLAPGWEFVQVISPETDTVSVSLEVRERDGGIIGVDELVDVTPTAGRVLSFTLDTKRCAVEGDVTGLCGITLNSAGRERESAELWFRIEVDPPREPKDVRVRCLHEPVWPQIGEQVTLRAVALDDRLLPIEADVIELWVNARSGPFKTCHDAAECDITLGPFHAATFSYACRVAIESSSGEEIMTQRSGWRQVALGMPPHGRVVPVQYSAPRREAVDVVFVADSGSYGGAGDPMFIDDVANAIAKGLGSREVFVRNQRRLNFWIALDPAVARRGCGAVNSDAWMEHFAFADAVVVVSRDPFVEERACMASRIGIVRADVAAASWPSASYAPVLGHMVFGLASEACCRGVYFQHITLPNLYREKSPCREDPLGDTSGACKRLMAVAPETSGDITAAAKTPEQVDWYRLDAGPPGRDDVMIDGGVDRPADDRRINWVFEMCGEGRC